MPVYSMTGFASVQYAATSQDTLESPKSNLRCSLEVRSVNSRFLDLGFRMPDEVRMAEPALRDLVSGNIRRGKVEVRIALANNAGQSLSEPDTSFLQKLERLDSRVRSWMPDARPLSVAEVLNLSTQPTTMPDDLQEKILKLAKQALDQLLQARAREGERLAQSLQDRCIQLDALAQRVEPMIPDLVAQQRERFMQRWNEAMTAGASGVDSSSASERALNEATAFAIRIDVAEELTRLRSHVSEIQALLKKGGEVGKRLDFLIQELHREANTLGSKSAALDLTRIGVDMKVIIEQMREQVQNIE
jgi:uncharacterized protein (TIGR00255 family)